MTTTFPLRCTCGAVRGATTDITPESGNRLICLCDDCQAFADFLQRADAILDAQGGTEVYQLTPAQMHISHGIEHARCMRLTKKGILRWYTACCRTPIGNTLATVQVPFVGIPHLFLDPKVDGRALDEILGPVRARVWGRYSRGAMPRDAHPKVPPALLLRVLRQCAFARLRGRQRPSPFFHPATGRPIAQPTILAPEERDRLRRGPAR